MGNIATDDFVPNENSAIKTTIMASVLQLFRKTDAVGQVTRYSPFSFSLLFGYFI